MRDPPASVPLPVVPRPGADERLSSWLGRLAQLYGMPAEALLAWCGLRSVSVRELEWRLGGGEGVLLAGRTGLTVEDLRALTFDEIAPHARLMIAERSRYVCPRCPAGVASKAAAFPWNFWCGEHAIRFVGKAGAGLDALVPPPQLAGLDLDARIGATRLADWAQGKDVGVPAVPAMLDVLTTRHRKSSPPSLAEQPILSLAARRAHHAFLTQPIARQALLIIVPEYDRVAPVLAKPVRPSLFSLAHGSLLQSYALVVGVGRLSADPVGCVATVLLASDREGEERLRDALEAWPLALRRRVSIRLKRLRAGGEPVSARVAAARPRRSAVQSHKSDSPSLTMALGESHHCARTFRPRP
jgi:hypothetical protein